MLYLSEEKESEWEGDWLFLVIKDIVSCQFSVMCMHELT